MPDEDDLQRALRRAHRRLADSLPHSPEWAAAIEAVEELERDLARRGTGRRIAVLRAI